MTENNGEDVIQEIKNRWIAKTGQKDYQIAHDSVWLIQWFYHRIRKNRNVIALFVGDTGSGKSYSSIRLAERLDPDFSADRIVFTVQDFIKLVNSDLPRGSVIIFDDAGLGIPAREWQNMASKIFGQLTQGFRYKQILTFITVPDESFIERQSRKLVHIRFEATDVQGVMKPKLTSRNPFDPERPLAKYPRIRRGISEIQIKTVKFALPSKDLREKYEDAKNKYMQNKFRDFEDQLNMIGQGNTVMKNGKPAIHLQCDECSYEWDYTGSRTMARCPNCDNRMYIADIEEKENSGRRVRCTHCGYAWEYTGSAKRTKCPDCGGYVNTRTDREGAA